MDKPTRGSFFKPKGKKWIDTNHYLSLLRPATYCLHPFNQLIIYTLWLLSMLGLFCARNVMLCAQHLLNLQVPQTTLPPLYTSSRPPPLKLKLRTLPRGKSHITSVFHSVRHIWSNSGGNRVVKENLVKATDEWICLSSSPTRGIHGKLCKECKFAHSGKTQGRHSRFTIYRRAPNSAEVVTVETVTWPEKVFSNNHRDVTEL